MNREDLIKEARTTEAMKRGYMGLEGKFAVIAKRLGTAIIHHGSSSFEQTFLPDPFDMTDENELPVMEEDLSTYELGLQFDGLKQGYNLSVICYFYQREIVCYYEGRVVYKEVSGELEGYVPKPEWEQAIDFFYNEAKRIERLQKPHERKQLIEEANKKKQELLEEFKNKWGLV